jgi:hypothetical protein
MRTLANKLISLLLIIPLLAGTLGISASRHLCFSSESSETKYFPELTGHQASCCCSDDMSNQHNDESPSSLNSPDCCRTFLIYLKADFRTTMVSGFDHSLKRLWNQEYQFPLASSIIKPQTTDHQPPTTRIIHSDNGPPLTGRQRVIFYSQAKIPGSASDRI